MMRRHVPVVALLALGCNGCAGISDPADAPGSAAVLQGSVAYTASTAILESFPVQLHTTLTMRNRSNGRVTIRLGSGCPVLLQAFRTEARTAPAWDQSRQMACTKEIQIVELAPGDTAQRSTRTNARAILGDSLPDGRYYLSAYVQVVGAPLLVRAGEADLGVPR